MSTDNEQDNISADDLRAQIAENCIGMNDAVTSALLAEEINNYGELQSCGLFPKDFGAIYGSGSQSLIQSSLIPQLPEPSIMPRPTENFEEAASPNVKPLEVAGLDSIFNPDRSMG